MQLYELSRISLAINGVPGVNSLNDERWLGSPCCAGNEYKAEGEGGDNGKIFHAHTIAQILKKLQPLLESSDEENFYGNVI